MEHTIDLSHSSEFITIDGVVYDTSIINPSKLKSHRLIAIIEERIDDYLWLVYEIDRHVKIWVNVEKEDVLIGECPCTKGYHSLPLFFLVTRDLDGDQVPDIEKIQNYVFGLFDCMAS